MFWMTVGNLTLANIFVLIFGLTGIKIFSKIVECPKGLLIPMIFMLSIVGAYAINTSIADVWWMIAFGVLGYFMKLYGFQVGPVILGVILARLVDENWRRAIISERESLPDFFANLFASPLSVALFTIIVLAVVTQTPLMKLIKRKG
jgi:putative tricarboxylic transport membrane protein